MNSFVDSSTKLYYIGLRSSEVAVPHWSLLKCMQRRTVGVYGKPGLAEAVLGCGVNVESMSSKEGSLWGLMGEARSGGGEGKGGKVGGDSGVGGVGGGGLTSSRSSSSSFFVFAPSLAFNSITPWVCSSRTSMRICSQQHASGHHVQPAPRSLCTMCSRVCLIKAPASYFFRTCSGPGP